MSRIEWTEDLQLALSDARSAVSVGAIWRGTPDNIETVDKDGALNYAGALIDALDAALASEVEP